MTDEYPCLGHVVPMNVQKWTHSICFEDIFVSEWQAAEDAFHLVSELGTSLYRAGNVGLGHGKGPDDGKARVSFAHEVEVAICHFGGELNRTFVPMNAFASWTDKPWTLRSSKPPTGRHQTADGQEVRYRTFDEYYNVPSNWGNQQQNQTAPAHGHGDDAQDAGFFLHEASQYIQNLFQFFLDEEPGGASLFEDMVSPSCSCTPMVPSTCHRAEWTLAFLAQRYRWWMARSGLCG